MLLNGIYQAGDREHYLIHTGGHIDDSLGENLWRMLKEPNLRWTGGGVKAYIKESYRLVVPSDYAMFQGE